MTQQAEHENIGFDVAALTERLRSDSGACFVIEGVSGRALSRSAGSLRSALTTQSLELVVVDPRSPRTDERTLQAAVLGYVARVQGEQGVDRALLRLTEALARCDREGRSVRVDIFSRLWIEVSRVCPAVLLALDAAQLADDDREALEHIARFVYADPIAALAPESEAWERPQGMLVLGGEVGFEHPDAHRVDLSADAIEALRAFLTRDDVIRRILESTEGDVSRIDDVVKAFPASAHLGLYRYDAMEARERSVVDVLSVAARPLAPDLLRDALSIVDGAEYFTRTLRALEEGGVVAKTMGGGRVLVSLGEDLGEAVVARLSPERRAALHRALAEAERVQHEVEPDVVFIAEHYLAAGDHDPGLRYGREAVTRLCARRDFAHARRMLGSLAEIAGDAERGPLELQLAGVLEKLGEYQEALEACMRAGDAADSAAALLRARLLSRIGKHPEALEIYEKVSRDDSPNVRREASLGHADTAYSLGRHEEAIATLRALIDELVESSVEPSVRDRAIVSARNTLGKIAMVRNEASEAVDLFEENRDLAARWGWDDEVARAQANLGVAALQRDDYSEALERLELALSESSARGSLPRAYCLGNIAAVHQRRGDFGSALDHCLEAMRCARKAGDPAAYAIATRNLATIYQDVGAYERAIAIVDHLREEYEEDPDTLAGGWNLFVRGHLLLETGEFHDALETFESLLHSQTRAVFQTQSRIRLAEIHFELGHVERAREFLSEAADGLGAREKYQAMAQLVEARLALGSSPAEAVASAREAHRVLVEAGAKNEPIRAQLVIADGLVALGREAEAKTELERTLGRLRDSSKLVPERFRADFWRKPMHVMLVDRLRELQADIPDDCVPCDDATETTELVRPAPGSTEFLRWRERYGQIVGEDTRLHHVFRVIDRVASSDASVLVYGESGTGKELVASALHQRSERVAKPFVKVNCAAFVENLLLSELFGHEKGAFTGASEQKIGRFERADGGTIFLDEIGDISPNTQVALLRVLQEGTFERVGGSEPLTVNVRVVCATNRDLEEMVRRGEFRLDLYYRLKGVVIEMPALRERREDIPRLARHFAAAFSSGAPKRFSDDALQFLTRYSWPGNVRELQNFVRSVLLFVDGDTIGMSDIDEFRDFFVSGEIDPSLPVVALDHEDVPTRINVAPAPTARARGLDPAEALVESIVSEGRSLSDIKKQLELDCIKRALIETGGNVTQAAEILQMKRPRLSQIINGDDELSQLKNRLAG